MAVHPNSLANLTPPSKDTDCPQYKKMAAGRDALNKRRQQAAKKRKQYDLALKEFKAEQFNEAQARMESGDIRSPAEMIIDMIKEQELAVANPALTTNELKHEKELLIKLYDRYTALVGVNAPTAQQIDVTSKEEVEETPDSVAEEIEKFTAKIHKI